MSVCLSGGASKRLSKSAISLLRRAIQSAIMLCMVHVVVFANNKSIEMEMNPLRIESGKISP